MTGSIDKYRTKSSSKPHWRYRIFAGRDATGKKVYVSAAGFATQGEAADAMHARIDELRRKAGELRKPATTFGEHMRQWLQHHAPQRCSPKTLDCYRGWRVVSWKTRRAESRISR